MAVTATGIYHRTYSSELRLRSTRAELFRLGLMVVLLIVLPFVLDNYWLSIVNTILIAVIGAVGLNILVGYTGQISLGQGGFLAVGAYSSALISERMGMPVPLAIALATSGRGSGRYALRRTLRATRPPLPIRQLPITNHQSLISPIRL